MKFRRKDYPLLLEADNLFHRLVCAHEVRYSRLVDTKENCFESTQTHRFFDHDIGRFRLLVIGNDYISTIFSQTESRIPTQPPATTSYQGNFIIEFDDYSLHQVTFDSHVRISYRPHTR